MAKKRALEPESEVLLRKEHDKAKRRVLKPESEAILEENKTVYLWQAREPWI